MAIRIRDYVEGNDAKRGRFYRGYLEGYALLDKTDPGSIVAEVAVTNSKSVYITMESLKPVSRYETLLKALEECGLKYEEGKIVGRHHPKFSAGDIARHKNYGNRTEGNIVITYVSECGYSYNYQNNTGGGTFGFSYEDDYNLIKEDKI